MKRAYWCLARFDPSRSSACLDRTLVVLRDSVMDAPAASASVAAPGGRARERLSAVVPPVSGSLGREQAATQITFPPQQDGARDSDGETGLHLGGFTPA